MERRPLWKLVNVVRAPCRSPSSRPLHTRRGGVWEQRPGQDADSVDSDTLWHSAAPPGQEGTTAGAPPSLRAARSDASLAVSRSSYWQKQHDWTVTAERTKVRLRDFLFKFFSGFLPKNLSEGVWQKRHTTPGNCWKVWLWGEVSEWLPGQLLFKTVSFLCSFPEGNCRFLPLLLKVLSVPCCLRAWIFIISLSTYVDLSFNCLCFTSLKTLLQHRPKKVVISKNHLPFIGLFTSFQSLSWPGAGPYLKKNNKKKLLSYGTFWMIRTQKKMLTLKVIISPIPLSISSQNFFILIISFKLGTTN